MVWMDFFSLFACSEKNCTYLFIYSAVKWNQHHILVMIECSNRDKGGWGIRQEQWNKGYSGMILNWCLCSFFFGGIRGVGSGLGKVKSHCLLRLWLLNRLWLYWAGVNVWNCVCGVRASLQMEAWLSVKFHKINKCLWSVICTPCRFYF